MTTPTPTQDNPLPAYMIVFIRIEDQDAYNREYAAKAGPIAARHGGEPLIFTETTDTKEGKLPSGRFVVSRFPSRSHVEAFYADPEYQPLIEVRNRFSSADLATVDGFRMPR